MSEENNSVQPQVIGTSDMPEPQVLNYEIKYTVQPALIADLEEVLGSLAYVDAKRFIDKARMTPIFTTAILTEFLSSLQQLPYKTIKPLMRVLETPNGLAKYFVQLPAPSTPGRPIPNIQIQK